MNSGLLRLGVWCALLVPLAALAAAGCRDRAESPSGSAARELPPPDQVYTVRGRIVDLPDPSRPASGFLVLHEAIDNFVGRGGDVVGMDAMTMPFTPARELSLDEFNIDDYVELTFEVRWKSIPRSRVIQLRKLPDDTQLEFRKAQPPG